MENQVILSEFKFITSLSSQCYAHHFSFSITAQGSGMKSHPLVLDFSFRAMDGRDEFWHFWRHSECYGDLNKLEAGFGMHYIQGIIPGSGEGLFQKIEFVPPRGEMRLKKLNSRRRRRLIHGDKDFIFGGRRKGRWRRRFGEATEEEGRIEEGA